MSRIRKQKPLRLRRDFHLKLAIMCGFLCLFGVALFAKLFYLQIVQHEELLSRSEKQYLQTVKVLYGRGKILDRNLNELAANIEVESVYVNPRNIVNKEYTARMLASLLALDGEKTFRKISSKKQFIWIKRKCDLDETAELRHLDLPGVGFITEHKRFYPKRGLASATIGFVGLDNQGLAGIEHAYDSILKGTTFLKVIERDARGKHLGVLSKRPALSRQSSDVALTLDESIQYIAEFHLEAQVKKYNAKGGMVVVMAPDTGEIYAMAAVPRYNPNNYAAFPARLWKNPIISSSFEPGSTFKPIVAAAAIEGGLARPDDLFFCENGSYYVGGTRIGEASNHKFGWLSLSDIIVKSSNIGAVKVAEKLGPERLYKQVRKFGFGEKAGIGLPGENAGKLRGLTHWSKRSLASISFGHEIGATPIQMVAAFAVIANGGNLVRPSIVKAVMKNGRIVQSRESQPVRRVISAYTSRQVVEMLKNVVKKGTASQAAVAGFEVAGKTGTAQKIDPKTRAYSKTAYLSSFIGFVPADAPKLVILVMIDEPESVYWGGKVAAPVFRKIAKQTLRYLNIPSRDERVFILDRV